MGRWLGVDYGSRRIGLAVGDDEPRIASPLGMVPGRDHPRNDAESVRKAAEEAGATAFVVGLPLNMDDSEGPQAQRTRAFIAALRQAAPGARVEVWDERLSSFQADQHLAAAGLTASQRKARRDALAAQTILQSFFDSRPPIVDACGEHTD